MTASTAGDALRALASLLRGGLSQQQAVAAWPRHVNGPLASHLETAARRVVLGSSPADALADDPLGTITAPLRAALATHEALGGEAAASLEALAAEADRMAGSAAGALAGAAGTTLSARMVSALPLVFAPLVPGAGLPLGDPIAMTSLLAGVALAAAGMAWIRRLMPSVPQPDAAASVALVAAAVLRGGASSAPVLDAAACSNMNPDLELAARRVRLGLTWEEALALADEPGFVALAATLAEARVSGAPLAEKLRGFASERIRGAATAFDQETRKAPVRMVVPLTVCVLPAFLLIAAGPLVRGLSG